MKNRLSLLPQGETDRVIFEFGHTCGLQRKPSIGIQLPDERIRKRNSVLTRKDVDKLIKFLTHWQKQFPKYDKDSF